MNKFAVVGLGLIGSAALRYLSEASNGVIGIGIAEPDDYESHDSVFASHYDNGRLAYRSGQDPILALLNSLAFSQFEKIEAESGVKFHYGQGTLTVHPPGESIGPQFKSQDDIAYQIYNNTAEIHEQHPMFLFADGFVGHYEAPPAGSINPRALVEAQLTVAKKNGATIVRDTVTNIDSLENGVQITTRNQIVQAEKVIVATGAFSNDLNLPAHHLRAKAEMTILVAVANEERANLGDMPSVIYEVQHPTLEGFYMNPPIPYANGRYYIKIGCNTKPDQWFDTLDQKVAWMKHGTTAPYDGHLFEALKQFVPSLKAETFEAKRCLTTYTAHEKPYIDEIEDNIITAYGGNGKSAKSSDALGYLAAQLAQDKAWPAGLEREMFRFVSEE